MKYICRACGCKEARKPETLCSHCRADRVGIPTVHEPKFFADGFGIGLSGEQWSRLQAALDAHDIEMQEQMERL